ncbi:hypothetical protein LCGC14_2434960 [marine sediment metagenome]|uniref:Uncharacterized protein n=1 Tax=marine sediment metagenome TaxID=412755 RepID=A0A0F9EEQ9_9ZZZZ
MTEGAATEPGTKGFRLPWTYERRRFVGRCIGAVRVLLGKSASIPKGKHDTAIGIVNISDYYGGCILSIQRPDERDLKILGRFGRDLYWTSQGYDGSGSCMNCREAGESDVPLDAPAS